MINPVFKHMWSMPNITDFVEKGGRASMKSSAISIRLLHEFLAVPEGNAVIFRKVARTLSTSVYEQVKWAIHLFGLQAQFDFRRSPLQIIHRKTGTGFYFYGVDDPMKLKSMKIAKGYVQWLWFEELAEFSNWAEIDTVRLTYTREKLPNGKHVLSFYSYNPPRNPYDWINEWVEQREAMPGWQVVHTTYLDDALHFLSQQYLDEIETNKRNDPDYYRWQFLGESVGLGSNVYNMSMFHPLAELPTDDKIVGLAYSLDGGHAESATTCSLYGFTAKRKVILLDTLYYSPHGKAQKLAPSQLSELVHDFVKDSISDERWTGAQLVNRTIDSAEAALRNQYYKDWGIKWHPVAKKKKQTMIDSVYSLLAEGRFYYLNHDHNKVWIDEHQRYQYDEKTLNTDDPRVVKVDDHCCDQFQYLVLDNAKLLGLKA